jgi:hypothetical protein
MYQTVTVTRLFLILVIPLSVMFIFRQALETDWRMTFLPAIGELIGDRIGSRVVIALI